MAAFGWSGDHVDGVTRRTRAAAHAAKRSTLPPTYQRAQHLRKAYIGKTSGKQLPRLMVVGTGYSWCL